MNIAKKLYWKIVNPLKLSIVNDVAINELRDRLIHIEDEITPPPPQRVYYMIIRLFHRMHSRERMSLS